MKLNRRASKIQRVDYLRKQVDLSRQLRALNGGHVGQWMDVDGKPVHVLADPNMSQETRDALSELVRAAMKWVDDGMPGKGEGTEA